MFDQLKAMGAVAGLLRDKERLQAVADEARERLERIEVVGEAGGGAVRATVSGRLRVLDVRMEPAMLSGAAAGDESRAMAERLVAEAVNDGMVKAGEAMKREMSALAEELGLPDVPGLQGLLGPG